MINPIGFFKMWRELFIKPIWLDSTPEQKTILITLLAMANYNGNEWEWKGKRYKADKGQFVTSLDSIAKNCGKGVTQQNVRTALKRFEKYEFLTNESTNKNRLITILNWHVYQQSDNDTNKQPNKQLTSNSQATNKQLTTIEEVKKLRSKEIKDIEQFFEKAWSLYPKKKGKGQVSKTQKQKLEKVGLEELTKAIERYKKENTDIQFVHNGSTFFNSIYIDYLDANYEDKPESTLYKRG